MHDDVDDVVIEDSTEDGDTGTPEQKLKLLRDKLKAAQAEANDNLAGWQRAKADYVNLSKRLKDMEGSMSMAGVATVVRGLVDVFDSVEASGHPAIMKQLTASLIRLGVERITPAVGDMFDPAQEEAVQTVATNNKEEDNTVAHVLQSGYRIDAVTLRPARVSVYHLTN